MAATTVTLPHVPLQRGRRHIGGYQHRRGLLGALAAVPVAAAGPAEAGAEDPHVEWEREHASLNDELRALDIDDEPAHEAVYEKIFALEERSIIDALHEVDCRCEDVGAVVVTKIEKKSAMTRRVVLGFAGVG